MDRYISVLRKEIVRVTRRAVELGEIERALRLHLIAAIVHDAYPDAAWISVLPVTFDPHRAISGLVAVHAADDRIIAARSDDNPDDLESRRLLPVGMDVDEQLSVLILDFGYRPAQDRIDLPPRRSRTFRRTPRGRRT